MSLEWLVGPGWGACSWHFLISEMWLPHPAHTSVLMARCVLQGYPVGREVRLQPAVGDAGGAVLALGVGDQLVLGRP